MDDLEATEERLSAVALREAQCVAELTQALARERAEAGQAAATEARLGDAGARAHLAWADAELMRREAEHYERELLQERRHSRWRE